ncbi:hypothetical protein CONPUDRAFT_156785 [Coniophora puteana RWD-64-598 SS2]|uniref:Uncharacterized protein n=1 Tax=Coniophora puteana (strain RWD-64-598) TaxID=741705 RepID=A0A5M3MEZ0_CONPW|nr:uncharacterized protein CONPUDRAFT_156785 [Coniophora puteana RWD-64-598 SS2]EIW77576.1 hypothetical protein CONPUDRAFT_156785 [Coniophora puteana RWD-64-598 SS2]
MVESYVEALVLSSSTPRRALPVPLVSVFPTTSPTSHTLTLVAQEGERTNITDYLLKSNSRLILFTPPVVVNIPKSASFSQTPQQSALPQDVPQDRTLSLFWVYSIPGIGQSAYSRSSTCSVRPIFSIRLPQNAKLRSHAVACLSYFVPIVCTFLFTHTDTSLPIFSSGIPTTPVAGGTRAMISSGSSSHGPEMLMPGMASIAEYPVHSTKDKKASVTLKACEFWLTFANGPDLARYLLPLLPCFALALLDHMACGKGELLWLGGDAEDNTSHGFGRNPAESQANEEDTKRGANGEETIDNDDEDHVMDKDQFADEMPTEGNVNKCAVAALDVLMVIFRANLINVLLDPLKVKVESAEWMERESANLAFCVMAEGV